MIRPCIPLRLGQFEKTSIIIPRIRNSIDLVPRTKQRIVEGDAI